MRKLVNWVLLALICLPAQVLAWGFEGHEYIGHTAYQYLTPEAREWVDTHLQRLDEESLATATTWADRVRGTDEGRWMGPLHYANIPPQSDTLDMLRDCPNRRCVVGAAKDALDVLFDTSAEPMQQADQLRKLTHWLTDMHQPLHLGFARDRGGNDTELELNGEATNLHRLWDSQVLHTLQLPEPSELAAKHPLPEPAPDWHRALLDWAAESNRLARDHAYASIKPGDSVSDAYMAQAQPVVEQQLLRAAQRLAGILNDAAAANQN
ncbi:S1/P1 nuclease [Aliidiomarina sp. Khilg15.8]